MTAPGAAVMLNERPDIFGQTVNIGRARAEPVDRGRKIHITGQVLDAPRLQKFSQQSARSGPIQSKPRCAHRRQDGGVRAYCSLTRFVPARPGPYRVISETGRMSLPKPSPNYSSGVRVPPIRRDDTQRKSGGLARVNCPDCECNQRAEMSPFEMVEFLAQIMACIGPRPKAASSISVE